MRKKVGDFFEDDNPPGSIETQARTDFNAAREYAISLIRIHDDLTGGNPGRPPIDLEALKRSALILAVTAWESFVEDTVQQQLELRLNAAYSPSQVQSLFNSVAHEWLSADSPKHHPPELIDWSGDSWKQIIMDSFNAKLDRFHTPNTENVDLLFDRYLQFSSVSNSWTWQGVASDKATQQLEDLIKLRGRAVHRGVRNHPMSQPEAPMKRAEAVKALNLVYNLMDTTEKALGVSPSPIPPQPASP